MNSSFWEWTDTEKREDVTVITNSGSGQTHQLQEVKRVFNVQSLWLIEACDVKEIKRADQ